MNKALKIFDLVFPRTFSRYAISLLVITLFFATFCFITYWVANKIIY